VPNYTASHPKITKLLIRVLVGSSNCVYELRREDILIDIIWILQGTL